MTDHEDLNVRKFVLGEDTWGRNLLDRGRLCGHNFSKSPAAPGNPAADYWEAQR